MPRLAALCLLCVFTMPTMASAEHETPEIMAVLFYADWCGSCKILDPEIEAARAEADLDNKPVLFVRLDMTDATRRYQAGLLASSLGFGDYYAENDGATGFLLLVDAETKDVVAKLTKELDAAAISSEIQTAIEAAST